MITFELLFNPCYVYISSRRPSCLTFQFNNISSNETLGSISSIYFYIQYRVFFIHSACLVTSSETMSSSISFTCTPELASGISIRSQYSTNDSERLAVGCWISSPGGRSFFDTKTTSNFRRCKSLPITT